MASQPRVAIVGSGISGLAAAHSLVGRARVTLYEEADYFGGHTHTVDVTLPDPQGMRVTHGVDTGFLVYNERTYPQLIALFERLRIDTADSDMSFSVKASSEDLEWSGSSLLSLFAQPRNLWRPGFWRMLKDLLRFNALATHLAQNGTQDQKLQPLSLFLQENRFSDEFTRWYLLPMLGCIWSCPTDQMLQFPVATMLHFCHNHGLLQITDRPQWRTVRGGARHYVEAMVGEIEDKRLNAPVQLIERGIASAAGAGSVRITSQGRVDLFDAVVVAVHSDTALRMLALPTDPEEQALAAIRYQSNTAVLHTDTAVLPRRRAAWAAWNYERAGSVGQERDQVCLHYWLNRLQPLPFAEQVVVSLNPLNAIDPKKVLGSYDYSHPVFDVAAIQAQTQLAALQGVQQTWFAGAWMGYGFHEDGLKAGLKAADLLHATLCTEGHA